MSIREFYIISALLVPFFSLVLAGFFPIFASLPLISVIFLAALSLILLIFQPSIVVGFPSLNIYYLIFLSVIFFSWLIGIKDLKNTYTLSVLILYFFIILMSSTLKPINFIEASRILKLLTFLSPLISIFFIITGLGGSDDPVTPQILLLFGSIHCAQFSLEKKTSSLFLLGLSLLGASFTANRMIAMILLLFLAYSFIGYIYTSRKSSFEKKRFNPIIGLFLLPIILSFIWLVLIQGSFINAFVEGDNAIQYGDIALNTSGRLNIWIAILNDESISFWFGSGHDIPPALESERWRHPHNDYLRIYSRAGILALIFFSLFLLKLYKLLRNTKNASTFIIINIWANAAFMLLLAFIGMMFTDNTLVYPSFMGPAIIFWIISINAVRLKNE